MSDDDLRIWFRLPATMSERVRRVAAWRQLSAKEYSMRAINIALREDEYRISVGAKPK